MLGLQQVVCREFFSEAGNRGGDEIGSEVLSNLQVRQTSAMWILDGPHRNKGRFADDSSRIASDTFHDVVLS